MTNQIASSFISSLCNNCRYTVGQRFGRHIDESVYLENGLRTYYTLLIYLSGRGGNKDASSDSLAGGETVFYDQGRVVAEVTIYSNISIKSYMLSFL